MSCCEFETTDSDDDFMSCCKFETTDSDDDLMSCCGFCQDDHGTSGHMDWEYHVGRTGSGQSDQKCRCDWTFCRLLFQDVDVFCVVCSLISLPLCVTVQVEPFVFNFLFDCLYNLQDRALELHRPNPGKKTLVSGCCVVSSGGLDSGSS